VVRSSWGLEGEWGAPEIFLGSTFLHISFC